MWMFYGFFSTIFICVLIFGLYQKNTNTICISKRRLDGNTVLVTGGTCGMGLEIAKDFALRGARVIVACPFEDEGRNGMEAIIRSTGNQNVVFDHLDLASFASVRKFAANFVQRETRLDILMNNAGINAGKRLTEDGWNLIFQVNYLGTFLLTILLLPLLKKTGSPEEPSRIVNTTSISHKLLKTVNFFDWETSDHPLKHYQNSKLCIAIFTRELSKRLNNANVVVNSTDPGMVGTRIFRTSTDSIRGPFLIAFATFCSKTPWEGAQTAIHIAVCDRARNINGKYFFNCKVAIPSSVVKDDKLSKVLWEKTLDVLKLEPVTY